MPAEIDTKWLVDHIDRKFKEADDKRALGLTAVHQKIDDHANEARSSLAAFSHETTAALGAIRRELGQHETRIDAIEAAKTAAATRADGWWKAGATIVLGGGGLTALIRWMEGK
ncbi:MAG: hypothetical protein SFY95_11395 [Planctomycetota bacterium]|nr:hypothetical protein [Planctomycetota bacterium]